MKKIILIGIGVLLIISGYFLWQRNQMPLQVADTEQSFISSDQTISFTYPKKLSVSQQDNSITLYHQINYTNHPACDFKGDAPTSPTLTDFHVTVQTVKQTVAATSKMIDPSLGEQNISGDILKLSPGFIDSYNNGRWNGYKITEGVEGCGHITYYLPISSSRTLVIQKEMIGALADVVDPTVRQKILAVSGVISAMQSETIFNSIVQSLQVK